MPGWWDSSSTRTLVPSSMDQERVESWVRALRFQQMALESQKVERAADSENSNRSRDVTLSSPVSQHSGRDTQVEVTHVTPFRSQDGTHTRYALTCCRGDTHWRIVERYSSIRRVYDIAKVSYPFVAGTEGGSGHSPCFPSKMLVKHSIGALERAEGLLLWLSTFSHVPIVSDFLMGDPSMSHGAVDVRIDAAMQSGSAQSHSEASTARNQNKENAAKGEAHGFTGEQAETSSRPLSSVLRGHASRDTSSSSGDSSRRMSQDGGSSRSVSFAGGNSGVSSHSGRCTSLHRDVRPTRFLPVSSPLMERSSYSASPASAKDSIANARFRDITSENVSSICSPTGSTESAAHVRSNSEPATPSSPANSPEKMRRTPSQPTIHTSSGESKQPMQLFDRTPSQTQNISSELHRLLNSGSIWHAGRLTPSLPPSTPCPTATGRDDGCSEDSDDKTRPSSATGAQRKQQSMCDAAESAHRDFKTVSLRAKAEQWLLRPEEVTVGKRMGQGAGGVIYHAKWRGLDAVAKMLRPEGERDGNINREDARNDLINEICLLSHLRHPCLVMFLGAVLSPDANGEKLLILNEYMLGGNLEDYFTSRHRQLGHPYSAHMEKVLQLSIELSRAVGFLHNCNPPIIHRDLKPANLLLTASGRLKVCDFGLSRVKDVGFQSGKYRMTGKTGSLRYMAPEVFQQDPNYDEKVDIYSLAMILHYICLGVQPLRCMSGQAVAIHATRDNARPPLDQIQEERGLPMADLIRRCWSPRAEERPSALDIVQLLEVISLWEKTAKFRVAQLSRSDQATAHALYHCATVGRCLQAKPARWRLYARLCWTRWVSYDGMNRSEAKAALVKFMQKHCGMPNMDEACPRTLLDLSRSYGATEPLSTQSSAADAHVRVTCCARHPPSADGASRDASASHGAAAGGATRAAASRSEDVSERDDADARGRSVAVASAAAANGKSEDSKVRLDSDLFSARGDDDALAAAAGPLLQPHISERGEEGRGGHGSAAGRRSSLSRHSSRASLGEGGCSAGDGGVDGGCGASGDDDVSAGGWGSAALRIRAQKVGAHNAHNDTRHTTQDTTALAREGDERVEGGGNAGETEEGNSAARDRSVELMRGAVAVALASAMMSVGLVSSQTW